MVMAEIGGCVSTAQLDIHHILVEAQSRWLRPAEICAILQNYKSLRTAPEPPNRPPSGSVFLFDRNVLRHFRKDGHNWRKDNDGRLAKEAHERLKLGGVAVLHCYYSYGEDNENIQRRSYWMLEQELSHIAFVHYLEVKDIPTTTTSARPQLRRSRLLPLPTQGNRENFNQVVDADDILASQKNEEVISNTSVDSPAASRFQPYDNQRASSVTDTTSLNNTQASEREEAEPAYGHQASHGFQSFHELQTPAMQTMDVGSIPYHSVPTSNNNQGQASGIPAMSFGSNRQGEESRTAIEQDIEQDQVLSGAFREKQEFGSHSDGWKELQDLDCQSLHVPKCSINQQSDGNLNLGQNLCYPSPREPLFFDPTSNLNNANLVEVSDPMELQDTYLTDQSRQAGENDLQLQALNTVGSSLNSDPNGNLNIGGVIQEGLKRQDIFDHWIIKEQVDVIEPTMQPGPGDYWETVGRENDSGIAIQVLLHNHCLSPSLSKDQLFSIIDFSPNWAYSGSKIKVLIMGKFLRSQEELDNYKWACMFGELEVPAEIVGDGVLRCHTPVHGAGRVPLYITCSNRLACSEVREFEFRSSSVEDVNSEETLMRMRFGKLLSLGSGTPQISGQSLGAETFRLHNKISELLKDDTEWEQMLNLCKQDHLSASKATDQLVQKLLKEKLHNWLLQKIVEGGNDPNVLDEYGQGVMHFAAALGYDWAIPPTIAAGVSVNFRDANGWTALHWAAYCGRERSVGFLISSGAAPGLLTDRSSIHPSGRTPADLAASNGHKGIAVFLAESALNSYLIGLDLEDSGERDIREKAVETVSKRIATPVDAGDFGLSFEDALVASICHLSQGIIRICLVSGIQLFQRKQLKECADSEFGISELPLGMIQAAAIRIQSKFRSWKGRKHFLFLRQHIIKIQAHVRGHHVRKQYKSIIRSVGILEKVILRWQRKISGLRGFKPEAPAASPSMVDAGVKEYDYDFLKEGWKQNERRMQEALTRVKSMVPYQEARSKYQRIVSGMQNEKAAQDDILNNPEFNFDILIDFETFFDEDTHMLMAP